MNDGQNSQLSHQIGLSRGFFFIRSFLFPGKFDLKFRKFKENERKSLFNHAMKMSLIDFIHIHLKENISGLGCGDIYLQSSLLSFQFILFKFKIETVTQISQDSNHSNK